MPDIDFICLVMEQILACVILQGIPSHSCQYLSKQLYIHFCFFLFFCCLNLGSGTCPQSGGDQVFDMLIYFVTTLLVWLV